METKRLFNVRNWIIFIAFVFVCGAVAGTVTAAFFKIMAYTSRFLWSQVPQTAFCVSAFGVEFNLYYVLLGVIGGILIGLVQRKYGDCPPLLAETVGMYKRDKNVPYNHLGAVFIAALLPLIFGASVGPEAGVSGIIVMLFCWVRDKYKSGIVCILENKSKKKHTRLYHLFQNPVSTFIGVEIKHGDFVYTIPKRKKWAAYIAAWAGAILAIRFITSRFTVGKLELAEFEGFSYTAAEFKSFFIIVILALLTGLVFLLSEKIFARLFHPLKEKKITRAVITGIILGLVGMFFPFAMFSGEEQMVKVVHNWQTWSVQMLFATGFVKIFLTNWCIFGGWRGGAFFPCMFAATILGFGLTAFIPADPTFIVLTFMAAYTAMSLGHPLIVIALCLLFTPAAAILPTVLAGVIGGVCNKKLMPKVLASELEAGLL